MSGRSGDNKGSHEVVKTRSGARAVLDRETGEVMHPLTGPLDEARTLYLEPSRLAARLTSGEPRSVVLLDVGLGAGSNALAAWMLSESIARDGPTLEIVSFDRTLEAFELAQRPEHAAAFGFTGPTVPVGAALLADHRTVGKNTTWRFLPGELPGTLHAEAEQSADVVFWDPFSPKSNAELWSTRAFTAVRRLCREGATLHTYSGATSVRSALLLAGFAVGRGLALASGRESTIAATQARDLALPLDATFIDRLSRSTAPFPPDAPGDALAIVARAPQFAATSSRGC